MSSRQVKQTNSKAALKRRKSATSKNDGKDSAGATTSTSKPELVERLSQNSTSTNDDE